MKEAGYKPRTYREWSKDKDLVSFTVVVKETDLYIRARRALKKKALDEVVKQRALLEGILPAILVPTALEPFAVGSDAPRIVREMARHPRRWAWDPWQPWPEL